MSPFSALHRYHSDLAPGMVNAHLIRREAGCVLIDTGIPGSERKVGTVLAEHGLTFRDIKLIVVTHAHTDCAGSAARVRALSAAPILAHRNNADCYSRTEPKTYCTTSWVGKLFLKTPVPHEPDEGFVPDITMTNGHTVNLLDFGVDGIVRHTGGHTPGSIAVELSSQDIMVGDLIASGILIDGVIQKRRTLRTTFEDDPATVSRGLIRMAETGGRGFHMGHGGPLEVCEVLRDAHALAKLEGSPCFSGKCEHMHH